MEPSIIMSFVVTFTLSSDFIHIHSIRSTLSWSWLLAAIYISEVPTSLCLSWLAGWLALEN